MSLANLVSQGWNPTGYRPAYISTSGKYYDAGRSLYNFKPSNTYQFRKALALVAGGAGNCNITIIPDSLGSGYNGTTEDRTKSWPNQLQNALALAGYPSGGRGVVGYVDPLLNQKVSGQTGVWSLATQPFYAGALAATHIWTSEACTSLEVGYSDLGGAGSVTIDGGGANPLPVLATSTLHKVPFNGLANAPHTLVFTATGANFAPLYIREDRFLDSGFVIVNNLTYGGMRVVPGNAFPFNNMNDASGVFWNGPGRLNFLPGVQDLFIIEFGMSDIENSGSTFAQVIAGYTQLINRLKAHSPNANIILVLTPAFADLIASGVAAAWFTQFFLLADSFDIPVIDWNDRIGGYVNALAMGLFGADNLHFQTWEQAGFGRSDANILVQ